MIDMKKKTHSTREPAQGLVRGRGHRLLTGLVLTGLLCAACPAAAQSDGESKQDLIRSAMVFNFCKFVQWPEGQTPGDSIVLGVMGTMGEYPDFSSIAGKNVRDVPIAVRQVTSREEIRRCQLVYIPQSQRAALSETLSVAQEAPILTISDLDGFCNKGGMIQLVERRGKIRFFINRDAAEQAQLSLSSQLLKVAKIVEGS
jgi:hypothetical protein